MRINERIRKSPIRLIDENNDQIGVIDTAEAQQRARAAGLDLVEVSPNSDPPVCRIMDYGKWKYQQKKKEQKAKAHSKQSETKEVRLRPGTDDHDLMIKTNRARDFFADGHKVQFTILFKGRQMAHRDIGFRIFNDINEQFSDVAHVEMTPRVQGRRMTMLMAPGVKQKPKAATQQSSPPPAAKPQAQPAGTQSD
ncbi:translation initiation factor IF-3 [Planctomycetales bacterium ZRK34]|nr:translation initiation factor IF-3 [Planctomycetales bacterium ZRK34]